MTPGQANVLANEATSPMFLAGKPIENAPKAYILSPKTKTLCPGQANVLLKEQKQLT
jgi:hypothetical protein